jgi:hypothetical protein
MRDSPVGIVSEYRLDHRGSITCKGKSFTSSLWFQTICESHPVFCTVGTEGHLPGVKRGLG